MRETAQDKAGTAHRENKERCKKERNGNTKLIKSAG